MPTQLSDTAAVLVSESNATSYFVGGTFSLGAGPFTELTFSASDDETDFGSFGAQYGETWGAGRQTGELTDGGGGTFDQGLASLEDVLTLSHPVSGAEILVGRVSMRVDTGSPGGGVETQDFYIFSAPIDPGVAYDITAIEYTPGSSPPSSFEYSEFAGGSIVCFASGTLISTENGVRPVETVRPGNLVQTADNGVQPVLWTGARQLGRAELAANPKLCPVLIAPGSPFGNDRPLWLSQQHRVLYRDRFVKARLLADFAGLRARIALGKRQVSYHHLLLEEHQLLFANGIGAESLFLGPIARGILRSGRMAQPAPIGIVHDRGPYGGLCRQELRRHEVNAGRHPAAKANHAFEAGRKTVTRARSD